MICCFVAKSDRVKEDAYQLTTNPGDSKSSDADDDQKAGTAAVVKKQLASSNGAEIVENMPMYMTETVSGGSRPNSLHVSLSTIFSTESQIEPTEFDAEEMARSSPKLQHMLADDVSRSNYYKFTFIKCPDGSSGSSGSVLASFHSSHSAKAKATYPIPRVKATRGSSTSTAHSKGSNSLSGSLVPNTSALVRRILSSTEPVSSTGSSGSQPRKRSELSSIMEMSTDGIDVSVFETPENTHPYYPNPNTPVEEACGVVMINAPFCPPTNTPIETSGSEAAGKSSVGKYAGTYFYVNEVSMSGAASDKLESCTDVNRWTTVKSLSINSTDLNNTAVPIHSSTITGAEDLKQGPSRQLSLSSYNTGLTTSAGEQNIGHEKAWETTTTAESDTSQSQPTVYVNVEGAGSNAYLNEPVGSWHYNKAYEHGESETTVHTGCHSDISSCSCRYCSEGLSHPVLASGQTSIRVQAGSRDTSLHSHVNDESGQLNRNVFSTFTFDSTFTSRQRPLRQPSTTPQAPANSPQIFPDRTFEEFINRITINKPQSSDISYASSSVSKRLTPAIPGKVKQLRSSVRKSFGRQALPKEEPLLSPETYWV